MNIRNQNMHSPKLEKANRERLSFSHSLKESNFVSHFYRYN